MRHEDAINARPVSVEEMLQALERAGCRDAFEADGIIIYERAGRMESVCADPAKVAAVLAHA